MGSETDHHDGLVLPNLQEVEEILCYQFKNKSLLEEALTHHSYPGYGGAGDGGDSVEESKEFSYERLEYVGDTVLNLLVTMEQYHNYPDLSPGILTRLRAANVNTEKLARVALKLGLHNYVRHRKPMLDKQIEDFTREISNYPLHSNGLVDAPKVLADIVESTIGAVFIDCNSSLSIVWKIFKGLLEPIISPKTLGTHPVTQLYELCQKRGWNVEFRDLWKETTTYNVFIEGQLVGKGLYAPKKEIALNRAAKDALDHIDEVLGTDLYQTILNKEYTLSNVQVDHSVEEITNSK